MGFLFFFFFLHSLALFRSVWLQCFYAVVFWVWVGGFFSVVLKRVKEWGCCNQNNFHLHHCIFLLFWGIQNRTNIISCSQQSHTWEETRTILKRASPAGTRQPETHSSVSRVHYIHLPYERGSYVLSLSSERLVFSCHFRKNYSKKSPKTKHLLCCSQLPSLSLLRKPAACQSKYTEKTSQVIQIKEEWSQFLSQILETQPSPNWINTREYCYNALPEIIPNLTKQWKVRASTCSCKVSQIPGISCTGLTYFPTFQDIFGHKNLGLWYPRIIAYQPSCYNSLTDLNLYYL